MNTLDQVAAAFEQKDYRTAAQLLKTLVKESPNNPWVQFYVGRLHEVSGKLELATNVYRQILKNAINPKVSAQARQGLQRVEAIEKAQRQQAIADATADAHGGEPGFLILEPVTGAARAIAAQHFARIMNLDAYTARMQLPSRSWQLYRTGPMGELQFYGQQLKTHGIPAFWVSLPELKQVQVLRVNYLQTLNPQVTAICQDQFDQLGSLTFSWSEVTCRVDGLLPIFGDVIDQGAWGKLTWKEQTQDYAQVCDLHLPSRNCILRFCDQTHQFAEDAAIAATELGFHPQNTARINWNHLLQFLQHQLPNLKTWSDFTPFAETTFDATQVLSRLPANLNLDRKAETLWDPAFQLYSTLIFTKR